MPSVRPIPVTAFVDWNYQIHSANPQTSDCRVIALRTLDHLGRAIGRTLTSIDAVARFDVSLRLYHGWHKGFQPTDNRRALADVGAGADFSALSTRANVQIRPDFSYGDRLMSALDRRLHTRLSIHLPNTLRRRGKTDDLEEKMVDTAIAADVVDIAHREPDRWILVVGDDDDLVPPIFTAEAVRAEHKRRVLILRQRAEGQFLKLDGILESQ